MIRKAFKVGDTITIKRTFHPGTGYRYALGRLSGVAALVEETIEPAEEKSKLGGMSVHAFTFQFLRSGMAEIQFVYYRDIEEVVYEDVFLYRVADSNETDTLPGGWSEYHPLTDHEKQVFQDCMTLLGVEYTPLAVSMQVIAGYNYRFFCMTKSITLKPQYGFAMVNIFVSKDGKAVLESIVEY